jgi:hypothetical protein
MEKTVYLTVRNPERNATGLAAITGNVPSARSQAWEMDIEQAENAIKSLRVAIAEAKADLQP